MPTAPKPEVFNSADAGIWFGAFAGAGALGLLVSAIGAIFEPASSSATRGWWRSCTFSRSRWGALFWVLVHHATDAEWSVMVRRVLENVAILVPVTLLFFLPGAGVRGTYLELVEHPAGRGIDAGQETLVPEPRVLHPAVPDLFWRLCRRWRCCCGGTR